VLTVKTQQTQFCQECNEPLPNFASKLFKSQEGLCPRCYLILAEWEIDLAKVEVRDLSLKGKSRISVPRVEFHTPDAAPANSIPL